MVLSFVIIIVILFVVLIVFVMKAPRAERSYQFNRPDEITPLSVISLLKQIRDDAKLGEEKRAQLDAAIDRIEQHFFYTENAEAPDLAKETEHWLAIAN